MKDALISRKIHSLFSKCFFFYSGVVNENSILNDFTNALYTHEISSNKLEIDYNLITLEKLMQNMKSRVSHNG